MYTFIMKDGQFIKKQIEYNNLETTNQFELDSKENKYPNKEQLNDNVNCTSNIILYISILVLLICFSYLIFKWKKKNKVEELAFGYNFY